MEETTYLKQKIKDCRHKLNLAKILENCVYYISFGALAAVLVEGISLFVPFYYANYFAAGCIGVGCLVGIVRAVMTWADEKAAARKLDSFGLQERTLTAYENLDKEDAFTKLQRNDAVQMLKENENNICIPIRPNTRHLLAFIFSLVCVCTLAMVPSVAKEQAKELHALKQEVKEKKKELSSVMDALEDIDTKSLSAEEKKKLQELMKSLEMSKKELDQVDSAQELASANERLQFKYQETAQSLTGIDPSKIGVKEAQQIAQAASGQTGGSSNGNDTAGANGQLADGSNNNGDSQSSSGDGNNGNNGNNTSGDGNSTENGNGDGNGNGNGNGQGNGDGNGSGSGNGNGQENGNGNGNGSGSGNGSGRGTGSSSATHDYVTVPNKVGDDSSLHGDKTGKNNSDYYRAQNGLTWEGDHVSLDSVIADYTQSAYEGISAGRYPSGMENVIKDYFKNLNE